MWLIFVFILIAAGVNLISGDPQSILFGVGLLAFDVVLVILHINAQPAPEWQQRGLTQQQAAAEAAAKKMKGGGTLLRLSRMRLTSAGEEEAHVGNDPFYDDVFERGQSPSDFLDREYEHFLE